MRVFISHSSKDKHEVERLVLLLGERGVDVWYDRWEIGPGDDLVAKIDEGLEECEAGLIVFSSHTGGSNWVRAEVSALIHARIEEGRVLIPVVAGEVPSIPRLLRPLARCKIEDVDAIAAALLHRRPGRPPVRSAAQGERRPVLVALRREGGRGGGGAGGDRGAGARLRPPRQAAPRRCRRLQGVPARLPGGNARPGRAGARLPGF